MKILNLLILSILFVSCSNNSDKQESIAGNIDSAKDIQGVSLIILGTIQDAGSPQIGCTKDCCKDLFVNPDKDRRVVSLGIVDALNNNNYLLEATPDFTQQVKSLIKYSPFSKKETPDGIFLTHAHIGHYTGLMYLGKEAMNTDTVSVYAMPRMRSYLEQNGPWSQLVTNKNIALQEMQDGRKIQLTKDLKIIPFIVPHRDEFSETVGYKIIGPNKTALFIPDIDKWEKWETNIIDAIAKVDYAFVDATFFDGAEINNRDISTIPHPFIIESMNKFKNLPAAEKKKIYFTHFNHTNPVINKNSEQYKQVIKNGFNVASIHDVIDL